MSQSTMIIITQIITASSVIYFALVILYHCFLHKFKNTLQVLTENRMKGSYAKCQEFIRMKSVRKDTVDVTCKYQEFQEPLVEFDL